MQKKFKKILWSGKHIDSGFIAYLDLFQTRREALKCFKGCCDYKVVKVELKEL